MSPGEIERVDEQSYNQFFYLIDHRLFRGRLCRRRLGRWVVSAEQLSRDRLKSNAPAGARNASGGSGHEFPDDVDCGVE